KMAERVVDMVAERLTAAGVRGMVQKGTSEHEPLSGGGIGDDVDAFVTRLQARWPRVPADIVDRLATVYGSEGERMVEAMAGDPTLAERCASLAVTRGEVAHAVREEMALTLEDFLERRARLFLWDRNNGLTAAVEVAKLMATLLGWDAQRTDAEVAAYRDH